jgi:hypothetical protein
MKLYTLICAPNYLNTFIQIIVNTFVQLKRESYNFMEEEAQTF